MKRPLKDKEKETLKKEIQVKIKTGQIVKK
jgi:hypothetical protein